MFFPPPYALLYGPSLLGDEPSFHPVRAKWEKSTGFPAGFPAKQSYALFMRIAKCTRASQTTYLLLLLSFDTNKKRAGISRIVRTHNGWSVTTNRSFVVFQLREYISRFASSIGKKKDGDGTKGGKIPGCKLKAKFRFLFHCSGDYRFASVSFPVYFLLRWSVYVSRDVVNLIQFTAMNVEFVWLLDP